MPRSQHAQIVEDMFFDSILMGGAVVDTDHTACFEEINDTSYEDPFDFELDLMLEPEDPCDENENLMESSLRRHHAR